MESWSSLGRSWELLSQSALTAEEIEKSWRPVAQFEAERVPVNVYVSTRTGMRVMMAKVEGPLVNAYLTLATEARTTGYADKDDGLPHALEHLVFMGSEDHPFRGIIDQLGNRSLAQSTNAWTDVDHTAYTLTTAGPQGFLSLLPVYLDHLLFPTLSDAAFLTEIHHVNADGMDAGVVYCEMEGKQFEATEVCRQRLCDLLYPEGSGYRAVTGGRVENLRRLTNEAVRAYHREYYRPDNLCIIITGQVEARDVFLRLEGLQAKLARAKPDLPPFVRPWFKHHTHAAASPSSSSHQEETSQGQGGVRVEKVTFPAEDETTGIVLIGWQGPSWGEFQAVLGIRLLLLYLADSAASPLHRALVDRSDGPLCSKISFGMQEGMPGMHHLQFEDVEVSRVDEVYDVFIDTVQQLVQEGPDMSRLRSLIQREKLRHLSSVEEDPHNTLAVMLLYSFLYGDRDGRDEEAQLKDRLQNTVSRLETLPCSDGSPEARAFWANLLRTTFLSPAAGTVGVIVGVPSRELARDMAEERHMLFLTPPPLPASPYTPRAGDEEEEEEERRLLLFDDDEMAEAEERERMELRISVEEEEEGQMGGAATPLSSSSSSRRGQQEGGEEEEKRCAAEDRAERLARAVAETSRPCPPDLIESFRVPSMDTVPRVPVCTIRNVITPAGETVLEVMSTHADDDGWAAAAGEHPPSLPSPRFVLKGPASRQAVAIARSMAQKGLGTEGELPFMIQWDHIETAFVEVTVWLETSCLPDNLRVYLELLLEVIFELPVRQDDGSVWSHEEVVRYLSSDTVHFSNALGTGHCNFYCGVWGQAASLTLKVESDKYWLAVRWLRCLLYRTEFCPERVGMAAQKLFADLHRYRHDGVSIASALMRSINFDATHSNHSVTSFMRQQSVLSSVLHRCRTNPSGLMAELEALRESLTHPSNLRVHVVSDLRHQPDPVRPWLRDFLPLPQARLAAVSLRAAAAAASSPVLGGAQPPPAAALVHQQQHLPHHVPILESRHLRTAEALQPTGKGLIISSPSLDSACLVQCVPLDLSYSSPRYAALLVAMEYLTAAEGELSKRIRGLGLADGYEITGSPEQGQLTLTIYKSSHLSQAYEEALAMLQAYASGASGLDDTCLQAAKRGVIFEYIERASTGPSAAVQSFLNYFRGTAPTFCSDLMAAVQHVDAQQVVDAMRRFLVPLFDVKRSSMIACCNSSQALKIKYDFVRKLGRPILESGTVERCFAAMEDDSSDTGSTTTESEASISNYGCHQYRPGGGVVRGPPYNYWGKALGGLEPQRLIIVCAAVASVALMIASNKRV